MTSGIEEERGASPSSRLLNYAGAAALIRTTLRGLQIYLEKFLQLTKGIIGTRIIVWQFTVFSLYGIRLSGSPADQATCARWMNMYPISRVF